MAITDNMMGILPSLQIKHHIIDSTPSLFMAHKPRARIGFIKCFVACFEWSMNISLIFNRNDKHINSSLCVIYLGLQEAVLGKFQLKLTIKNFITDLVAKIVPFEWNYRFQLRAKAGISSVFLVSVLKHSWRHITSIPALLFEYKLTILI